MASNDMIGTGWRLCTACCGWVLLAACVPPSAGAQESAGAAIPELSSADVERSLQWESGRTCRDLIDACLDEQGNDLYPTPEFSVSELQCRRLAEDRARCTFLSAMRYGPEVVRRSRCTATFLLWRESWTLERDWRRRHTALDCS